MLRLLSRVVLIAVSSSVVLPYTAAVLCHLLYSRRSFKPQILVDSLSPRRVYALSVVIFQKLVLYSRYAPLYLQWRQFYITADPSLLVKNLAYGRNSCCLDLHLPTSHALRKPGTPNIAPKPVVLFVYGGAWSSGDKSMYGALCAQLTQKLDVLVCCPNYSTYPQGCVDDMIQDIVDCIQWIYDNIHDYGGDKDRLMLVGHSAGAHLCSMTLLELLHDQRLHSGPFPPEVSAAAGMLFHDSHYGRQVKDPLEDSSGSSESFAVVSESGTEGGGVDLHNAGLDASQNSSINSSIVEVEAGSLPQYQGEDTDTAAADTATTDSSAAAALTPEAPTEGGLPLARASGDSGEGLKAGKPEGGVEGEEESAEEEDDNDSVVTVRPKDIERHATLIDLARSIKAFVGLSGVYHIGDHYKHESWRGIEHMSGMAPAMYGSDHFERFSPTTIVWSLDAPISLPIMVLVHGTSDYVVPVSSSQKMADALAKASARVSLRVIPDCDHYDICFDLMKPSRQFHTTLMTLLLETTRKVF